MSIDWDNIEGLFDFVAERLEEDSQLADRAHWSEQDDRITTRVTVSSRRLQAEVQSKRTVLLSAITSVLTYRDAPCDKWLGAAWIALENLRAVAEVWRDHPDFPG